MMRRHVLVPVLAVVCAASTGCLATRNFVRENLQQSETKVGQQIDKVEGRVAETRGVADEANKRAVDATQLATQAGTRAGEAATLAERAANRAEEVGGIATQAQAKAEQTDVRLTRLWASRNKRTVADTMVVKFGFDKWHLDDRAETSLLEVVRQLQENPDVIVNIEGYTDGTGPAVYNVELSRRRAEAVRRFIVEKGIELHRVQTIGLGQARPAASNSTRQGRDQNRRVAVKLVMPAD
jgi:outer membrane protein OmpA-like peptidoglycan-associated protein